MESKVVTVKNEQGIHMRPAGIISKTAATLRDCDVTLKAKGKTIRAKSILQITSAGIKMGDDVRIICEGVNNAAEEVALATMTELFESGFGE